MNKQLHRLIADQKRLIRRKNKVNKHHYNGIYQRYVYPILTKDHIPVSWRFDLDPVTNPHGIERLGVNSVFNSGALYHEGWFYLAVRMEGTDRKSIFVLARSRSGIDCFECVEPILFDRLDHETNLYDMRLTKHADGFIYGSFCAESLNVQKAAEMDAFASAGMVRTKDLRSWERLPNIRTKSPQQRNVILHPEFVDGKYMLYTRPQEGFISVGSAGGISYGFCANMLDPVIEEETVLDPRVYHTVYETKNGGGAVPIRTEKGFIHIAHGVRNTAAGLRYVLYAFATDLSQPYRLIAKPSGYLMAPEHEERIGDVSNVVFSCGAVEKDDIIYLYYASSDTRMHVATMTKEALIDYVFNNPKETFNTHDSTKQRLDLIQKNMKRGLSS